MSEDNDKTRMFQAAVELLGSSGRRAVIPVEGVSMVPTFPHETCVLVDFASRSPLMGEIILFHQAGLMVVHRFLARVDSRLHGSCLRTRGDGLPNLDPPLSEQDLLGRVIAFRRSGTWYRLEGAGARIWGLLAALHDHAWATVIVAANRLDLLLSRLGLPGLLRPAAWFLDRNCLRLADRILFRLLHRRMEPPGLEESDLSVQGQSRS